MKRNLISEFALCLGQMLGLMHTIKDDQEALKYFLDRGVTLLDIEKWMHMNMVIANAFYMEPKETKEQPPGGCI